jgi:hypothetical protein
MASNPRTLQKALTGGVTYDTLTIPACRRYALWTHDKSALNIKFVTADTPAYLYNGTYDSGWLPNGEAYDAPSVMVNGTGTLSIEYWT